MGALAILAIVLGLTVLPGAASAHVGLQHAEPPQTESVGGIPAQHHDRQDSEAGHANCHGLGATCHACTAILGGQRDTEAAADHGLAGRFDQARPDPPMFPPYRPPIAA